MNAFILKLPITISALLFLWKIGTYAQNPIITDQFTADPAARVFDGRVYLYPSHDILASEGKGRVGWFCMEDYHVFSSSDLTEWIDHGVIVSQNTVHWVDPASYSMWAPDCIYHNGKYYFYFPARAKDTAYGKGFSIGVAVADHPYGPFIPEPEPIKNVHGIDPCVFIDKDASLPDGQGQAYLYWSLRKIFVARLNENMTELASEPFVIENLPQLGLKEGPFVFERNGKYYLTYPHVENKIERIEYAIGDHPLGPFQVTGVIMDESPSGCWTNQQSIIEYNGQWYLFYHDNDLSPAFDKNRSVRVDSLFFNEDGTIRKVTPTLRGVGLTDASRKIQIDRYSAKSETGVSVAFLDTLSTFDGWKTILDSMNGWIQYNAVDFSNTRYNSLEIKASSPTGSRLQLRLDKAEGPILSEVDIPADTEWITVEAPVSDYKLGIHNLIIISKKNNPVEIDWIRFK